MKLWTREFGLLALVLFLAFFLAACSGNATTTTVGGISTGPTVTSGAGTTGPSAVQTASTESSADIEADKASPAQRVLNQVYTSVVNVDVKATVQGQPSEGVGSGVIYTADGYILTNDHVVTLDSNVSSGQIITVNLSDGTALPATIVGEDAARDIAVIKVSKTGLPPITFAADGDMKLAEWAIVIGSPLDYQNSVSLGIVSGLNRSFDVGNGQSLTGLVQLDAAVSPGNSGGGCFNTSGEFTGMPEIYLPPGQTGAENISFAIPSTVVQQVAKTLVGK